MPVTRRESMGRSDPPRIYPNMAQISRICGANVTREIHVRHGPRNKGYSDQGYYIKRMHVYVLLSFNHFVHQGRRIAVD
jgi:hypothetical protein